MTPAEKKNFWEPIFTPRLALNWIWWAKDVVNLPATLNGAAYSGYLFDRSVFTMPVDGPCNANTNRFAAAADDTWTNVLMPRLEREHLTKRSRMSPASQAMIDTTETKQVVFANFRSFADVWAERNADKPDLIEELKGISCIKVTPGSIHGKSRVLRRGRPSFPAYAEGSGYKPLGRRVLQPDAKPTKYARR